MGDRWIIIVLVLTIGLVVAGVVLFSPPKNADLRVAEIQPVSIPTPELTETPWRSEIVDIDLPPPVQESFTVFSATSGIIAEVTTPDEPAWEDQVGPEAVLAQRLIGLAYINYIQLGDVRRGEILNTLKGETHQVYEGYELPGQILVESLSPATATVRLNDVTRVLALARRPAFLDDPGRHDKVPSPEQQAEARDYYMTVYGDFLREQAKNYKPSTGVPVPHQLTAEEEEAAKKAYMETYAKQFVQDDAMRQEAEKLMDPELQRKNMLEYWKKFHPNKEVPPHLLEGKLKP